MNHSKPCPVTGCGALIRDNAAVCSEDWLRLPDEMQADLTLARLRGGEVRRAIMGPIVAYLNALPPLPSLTEAPVHA